MNSTLQVRLMQCVSHCLRPLARIMLRSGVGYRQFAELAKLAFVQEASAEKDRRGRRTNVSRIAIRTGLSRKDVSRLQLQLQGTCRLSATSRAVDFHSVLAARVLQLWHADPRFIDDDGSPKALPFADKEVSFSVIVKAAGGDVPPGAVRAEMLAAETVAELEDGSLRPLKRYFVPADVGEELLVGFTHMVIPVLEGLARNTDRHCTEPFIQRLVYSDRLAPRVVPLFRKQARDRVTDFVQSVDDWLSSNEIPDSQVQTPYRYGVGVFYYEGLPSVQDEVPADASGAKPDD